MFLFVLLLKHLCVFLEIGFVFLDIGFVCLEIGGGYGPVFLDMSGAFLECDHETKLVVFFLKLVVLT